LSVFKRYPLPFLSGCHHHKRRAWAVGSLLTMVVGLGGCSGETQVQQDQGIKGDVEQLLANELASEVGLGKLQAQCDTPPPLAVGKTWGCTGTTSEGAVVQVQASVNGEGRIELLTTNLISELALPQFERDAASNLNNEVGSNLTANSISCGDAPLLLGADMQVDCVVSVPSTGVEYDMVMRITDLDARYFALQVANQPRTTEDD